jgi:hygromycin-B 7''-O-kinase
MSLQPFNFATREAYAGVFTDATHWRPYVEAVCGRHGLGLCQEVRAGYPGTHAVFLVDGRYAVKLYTHLFGAGRDAVVEREVYGAIARAGDVRAPALVAAGELFPDGYGWRWPYIVTTVVPGERFGDVRERLSLEERQEVAGYLGLLVRRVHELPTEGELLGRTWDGYLGFLREQREGCAARHRAWGSLPGRLIDQIDTYLLPVEELVDRGNAPVLLHGDLTEDHLLGEWQDGRWIAAGLIDFGDARTGDWLYDLIALHIDLFRCDNAMLGAFLAAYGAGVGPREGFARRMLGLSLLYPHNDFGTVMRAVPEAATAGSLEELAALLWDW